MVVDVAFEERYWYPDDGSVVWLAGYQPVDPATGRYLANDAPELTGRDLAVTSVAGAGRHHAAALASDAFAPGSPLTLHRDPENAHDPNAIGVRDAAGDEQAGWVPRDLAARLAGELDAGRPWSAVVLRERRVDPRSPREGLTMLLAPASSVELRVFRPA